MQPESAAKADSLSTYLAAEVPRQFTILGQRLLPFSLWHLELLLRLRNGFVTPGEPIRQGDLLQGIFFCCQDWADGRASLASVELGAKLFEWGASVGKQFCEENPERFRKNGLDSFIEDKALEFAEYVREGSGRPELLPAEGADSRTPGAPLLQLLKLFLIRDLGMTMAQAMNYPFALACHDFFAFHEQRGSAKIANEDEWEAMAEHEAAGESDEILRACLDALPGAVPLSEQDLEKVKEWDAVERVPTERKGGRKVGRGGTRRKGGRCRSN